MMPQGTGQPGKNFVGVISDTHGLVRPQALAVLSGAERIIHAGDIGRPAVLTALEAIAPVVAVRGNNDQDAWAAAIPETAIVEVDGLRLYVLHDVKTLDFDPATATFSGVICGHSHRPRLEQQAGVWFINPGSAGPRRFTLPVTVARLYVHGGRLTAELVELHV
jgi:putative phosphoesterase